MDDKDIRAFPAPPHSMQVGDRITIYDGAYGMTLRDYFAAKAMQAMLINDKCTKALDQVAREQSRTFDDTLTSSSYLIADAMLKARK